MQISFNGAPLELEQELSMSQLVAKHRLNPGRIVVELNGAIVPNVQWEGTALRQADQLNIVSFVGGG